MKKIVLDKTMPRNRNEQVPDVSKTTVQRTLTELTKQGRIIKLGGGRYIKYRWNWDREDEDQ